MELMVMMEAFFFNIFLTRFSVWIYCSLFQGGTVVVNALCISGKNGKGTEYFMTLFGPFWIFMDLINASTRTSSALRSPTTHKGC